MVAEGNDGYKRGKRRVRKTSQWAWNIENYGLEASTECSAGGLVYNNWDCLVRKDKWGGSNFTDQTNDMKRSCLRVHIMSLMIGRGFWWLSYETLNMSEKQNVWCKRLKRFISRPPAEVPATMPHNWIRYWEIANSWKSFSGFHRSTRVCAHKHIHTRFIRLK